MRCYLDCGSVNATLVRLTAEGIITKVQHRVSGPHRGGILFRRGSLYHLLKNPTYRGKIVHKGEAYPGEQEAVVDEVLWDAVQKQLASKAPPRKRPDNDKQQAMLKDLLTDPHGRPMIIRYCSKGSRRYRYYESRPDLVKKDGIPPSRIAIGTLDKHVIAEVRNLQEDEHALRRLSGSADGETLSKVLTAARAHRHRVNHSTSDHIRKLVSDIKVHEDALTISLDTAAFNLDGADHWRYRVPLPPRKPFKEAKLRIDARSAGSNTLDTGLVELLHEGYQARSLIEADPELSVNIIAKREARCRKQLMKLLKVSWLSPRIVEHIIEDKQPKQLTRQHLLSTDLPLDWRHQEEMLGITR